MISATLREYIENYETILDVFLNDYEDNRESFFIQKELEKYIEYYEALTIISKKISHSTSDKLKSFSVNSEIASKLKEICPTVYNDIVAIKIIKIDFDEVDGDFLLPYPLPSLINIDFKKLENYIKSSVLILEYITNKINPPSLATNNYKSYEINTLNTIDESEKYNNELEQISGLKKSITTFKWKTTSDNQLSLFLWQKLIEEEFIASSTEFNDFHNAFSGLTIKEPLKIGWTAQGKNKQINKHLLFYLLEKLTEKKLIDNITDNPTLFKKIKQIFCKEDGSVISNLGVSYSTFLKKNKIKNREVTFEEEIIDDITDMLLRMTAK